MEKKYHTAGALVASFALGAIIGYTGTKIASSAPETDKSTVSAVKTEKEDKALSLDKVLKKDYLLIDSKKLPQTNRISQGNGFALFGSVQGVDFVTKCPLPIVLDDGNHTSYSMDPIVVNKGRWYFSKRSVSLASQNEVVTHILSCLKPATKKIVSIQANIMDRINKRKSWEKDTNGSSAPRAILLNNKKEKK